MKTRVRMSIIVCGAMAIINIWTGTGSPEPYIAAILVINTMGFDEWKPM